jgi:fluoroacetyl-CoA thioesterase
MDLAPGATAEVSLVVSAECTAHAMGNTGIHVLATPYVIGLLENAAAAVLNPHLPPGATTVGTMVEMRHLAATPVGMTVRARATLLQIDGKRFRFAVEASDDRDKIAEGHHERYLITDRATFLERALRKAGG